jgi:hypothetical protein
MAILYQGTLVEEKALANTVLAAKISMLPGVSRDGAASPRWTTSITVPADAQPGEYTLLFKALSAAGVANEMKSAYFVKPAAGTLHITDLHVEDGVLEARMSAALTADQLAFVDIQQLPPATATNPVPIPVTGFTNIQLPKYDQTTVKVPVGTLFNERFPFYGQFQILVKIVDAAQANKVLFARATPFFREKTIDAATDPAIAAFKELLKVFNYISTEQATRLAELKKFCVHDYVPGTMHPDFETMFTSLFANISVSAMQIQNNELSVEYLRPDFVIVHVHVARSHKFAKNGTPVFDPQGNVFLPPGIAGNTFAKDEWLEFPMTLVNNRWYLAFGQNETGSNAAALFVDSAFINPQQMLQVYLTRAAEVAKVKIKLAVNRAPDPTKGVFAPTPVDGFDAFELRPVNVLTGKTFEYALPMQVVLPDSFPVYGALELAFRVIEVATDGFRDRAVDLLPPYFRPVHMTDAERLIVPASIRSRTRSWPGTPPSRQLLPLQLPDRRDGAGQKALYTNFHGLLDRLRL